MSNPKKPAPRRGGAAEVEHLLQLLAASTRGELSTVLHSVRGVSEAAMATAIERGLASGTIEPLKVAHPPVRLTITELGLTFLKVTA